MVKIFWIAVAPLLLAVFIFMPIKFGLGLLIPVAIAGVRYFMMQDAVSDIWSKYDRADQKKNEYHW